MKTKSQINLETKLIYETIVKTMEFMEVDYCQSWWLSSKDNLLPIKLSTPEINRRAKSLVKGGYLSIDKSKTSTSMGTSYKLTDKIPNF